MMGTWQATPLVATSAAMLAALGTSREQDVERLLSTSRDLGSPGQDFEYRHGLAHAAAVVGGRSEGRTASAAQTSRPRPSYVTGCASAACCRHRTGARGG
jgi:hypothetical protein